MMRRSRGARLAAAAVGLVALSASAALAVSESSPYTNDSGVTPGIGGGVTGGPARLAGMDLNPGLSGQWLWGTYFDVRPVQNGSTGAEDQQNVNIQILNNNPNDPNSDGYNPLGGIIARVRFHESKTSREILDFDIVLSCGEVWTGLMSLPAAGSPPSVSSLDPISPCDDPRNTPTQFVTEPVLTGGSGAGLAVVPQGLTAADTQRGYFTVTAMEGLPCEPVEGRVVRSGNLWNRICANGSCPDATPTNALSGETILIRVAAGVSHLYNMEAVTRYIVDDGGSVYAACSTGLPGVEECVNFDATTGQIPLTGTDCVDRMNFILSKSRLMPQFDIQDTTGGSTRVVFTLPTKGLECSLNGGRTDFNNVAVPPFSCQGETGAQGGEQIGCVAYNRIEDFIQEGGCPVSPCPPRSLCALPRELSIFNITATDSASSQVVASVSDRQIDVTPIAREHQSGWIDFNLFRDPTNPVQQHQQFGLNPDEAGILGVGYSRYRGLPVLSLVLQEYINGSLAPSGIYGGALPPPYEVYYAVGS